jgi:transcriptional repressor NrdR
VALDVIEKAASKITEDLEREHGREIPSTAIGEKIMRELRQIDEVAYVRFASVYRQFRDINEFVYEVQNLKFE